MQLVDKQDDLPFLFRQVFQYRLEPLLEFAAKLGPGDQSAHVQRQHPLVFQTLRHFAVDDALGQALDNCGFTDARLADQHRIILGAPLQNLNGAADFIIAANHRIELALFSAFGQVNRVLLQSLTLIFGVLIVHFLAAAQRVDALFDQALGRASLLQQCAEFAFFLQRRQHEQLGADVGVLALLGEFVGQIQQARQGVGDLHIAASAADLRQALQRLVELRTQQLEIDAGLGEQWPHCAAVLIEQGDHDVGRLDELMIAAQREALRVAQGQLKFVGQFVHAHGRLPW